MLKVRKDNIGLTQGFHMTFKNGYRISVQFGSSNYCSNSLIPIETDKEEKTFGQCMNCETAIIKPNQKFLKYKGNDVQSYQTADDVAETIAYIQTLEANNYGRISR
jgi:hypothetical protein